MFISSSGDLLKSNAQVLVNAVNCEGVMGKGIAYLFKMQFPDMYIDYVKTCKSHKLTIGKLHTYKDTNKIIVNFPTKDRWRNKSELKHIELGLDELLNFIKINKITSIAIPKLGCGLGGLKWEEVRNLITTKLKPVSDTTNIYLYEI